MSAALYVFEAGFMVQAEHAELVAQPFVEVKRRAEAGDECYQSDSLAAFWLHKAASRFAPAAVMMALRHVTGEGVEVDFDKSLALTKQAAEADGHYAELPKLWRRYFDQTRRHMDKLSIDINDEKLNQTRFGARIFPDGTFEPNTPPPDWKVISRKCSVCAAATKSLCEQCRQVRYCSRACQKQDWSHHKPICQRLTKKN